MTYIPDPLRQQTRARAGSRCEYCQLHEDHTYYTHEIDHIYAEKHGGQTVAENLCLACITCNRYKGSDLCSIDPDTGDVVTLFHPRRDVWRDHFQFNAATGHLEPLSAHGRVTARVLRLNDTDLVTERVRLIALGAYEEDDL